MQYDFRKLSFFRFANLVARRMKLGLEFAWKTDRLRSPSDDKHDRRSALQSRDVHAFALGGLSDVENHAVVWLTEHSDVGRDSR